MNRPFELRLLEPRWVVDPYPLYEQYRRAEPVHLSALGNYFVTGYDDVSEVLTSRHTAAPALPMPTDPSVQEILRRFFSGWLPFTDGEARACLRSDAARMLPGVAVGQLRPSIERRVDAILDRATRQARLDVMTDLADPVPLATICDLLGIPAHRHDEVRRWSEELAWIFSPIVPERRLAQFALIAEEALELAGRLVDAGADGCGHALLNLSNGLGERGRDENQAASLLIFMLGAGFTTTRFLICEGVHALLRHPDQLEALRRNPTLAATAVEEMVRFDAPIQFDIRTAIEPIDLPHGNVAQGSIIVSCLAAANRDPEQFDEPDEFRLGRCRKHLGFGAGPRGCLGAGLGKLQAEVIVKCLLDRFEVIELLPADVQWTGRVSSRRRVSLPVAVR